MQFAACVNGGLTLLEVQGQGTARDESASVPLYAVGPSGRARWLFDRHGFVSLGFVSRFFLKRPELVVEGVPQRRRVETASVSAELGAGVVF